VEEIGEHGGRGGRADQALGLERLHEGFAKMLALGVEQPAIGAADAIGPKRLFEVVRLKEDGESGERAFAHGRARQRGQRRPDVFLHLRGDRHTLALQDRDDPISRPRTFRYVLDTAKRLQRNAVGGAFGEATAEIVPVSAHRERGRTDRAAEVEGEDL